MLKGEYISQEQAGVHLIQIKNLSPITGQIIIQNIHRHLAIWAVLIGAFIVAGGDFLVLEGTQITTTAGGSRDATQIHGTATQRRSSAADQGFIIALVHQDGVVFRVTHGQEWWRVIIRHPVFPT